VEAVEVVQNTDGVRDGVRDGRAEASRLLDLALAAIASGPADIAHCELRALSAPEDPVLRIDLAVAYRRAGRLACAERQLHAALSFGAGADAKVELASLYLELGFHAPAGDHARAAIASAQANDGLVLAMAWRILADLAELEGDIDAQRTCLARACAHGAVFPQPAPGSPFETLLLSVSGQGNTPTDALLPPRRFGRSVWFMDHATPTELANPPPHQVAFNAVGDADALEPALSAITTFTGVSTRPVLNAPRKVAATRRDRLPATLARVGDLVVPQVFRISAESASEIARAVDVADPDRLALWLHRPAGRHGGEDLERLSTEETLSRLAQPTQAPAYLTRYHHYRSADGFYRKYRIIFVGREMFPYHLAIAPDWMVHHRSAGMEADPVRRAEEMAFLADPRRVLGDRAYAAAASIGAALGLDYAGVDFSLTADGRVLVFEANASMCVHVEPEDGVFAAKNAYVTPILEAFQRMLAKAAIAEGRL
jgi:hypothetical protein